MTANVVTGPWPGSGRRAPRPPLAEASPLMNAHPERKPLVFAVPLLAPGGDDPAA